MVPLFNEITSISDNLDESEATEFYNFNDDFLGGWKLKIQMHKESKIQPTRLKQHSLMMIMLRSYILHTITF